MKLSELISSADQWMKFQAIRRNPLGTITGYCLWGAAATLKGPMSDLAFIVDRLFSARVEICPGACVAPPGRDGIPSSSRYCHLLASNPAHRIVHFNNHPETTFEDVAKVIRVYEEEEESRDGQDGIPPN